MVKYWSGLNHSLPNTKSICKHTFNIQIRSHLRSSARISTWPAAFLDNDPRYWWEDQAFDIFILCWWHQDDEGKIKYVVKLQQDINEVYFWTEKNNAQLNGDKFEHVSFGKDKELMKQSNYFFDTNSQIKTKESVKRSGYSIMLRHDMQEPHRNGMPKGQSISAWIFRTFKSRDANLMLTLWKSLVIPHHDYCSQLWSPSTRHLMVKLETLQKSFLDRILSLNHLNYWEKLKALKLYSLERRRERHWILYTWYILEQLVPNFNFDSEVGGILMVK